MSGHEILIMLLLMAAWPMIERLLGMMGWIVWAVFFERGAAAGRKRTKTVRAEARTLRNERLK